MRTKNFFYKYTTWEKDPRTQHLKKLIKEGLICLCEEGIEHKLLPKTTQLINILLTGKKGDQTPRQLKLKLNN